MNEDFLDKKLGLRKEQHAFRRLRLPEGKTDLCSNDYLGIATNGLIERALSATMHVPDPKMYPRGPSGPSGLTPGPSGLTPKPIWPAPPIRHGSGGSRLLAGNYPLIEEVEKELATFHEAEAGLIFNSGYDANLGLLSCIAQRGDTILYDHLSHASIRDGIRLSFAKAFSFAHNDPDDLEKKLQTATSSPSGAAAPPQRGAATSSQSATGTNPQPAAGAIFVVTESVFSMDGDQAPLSEIAMLCEQYGAQLIVDEAHATGVVGERGEGLVQTLKLENACLARIHTFGKAVGCHGAIVLGSERLRDYLINFCRSFIYTTALPESSVLAIRTAYRIFPDMHEERDHLQALIHRFQRANLYFNKLYSLTPIQGIVAPGNEVVRGLADKLQAAGLDIRPILYPTVPKGSERLRIVLHAFNTMEEMDMLVGLLGD